LGKSTKEVKAEPRWNGPPERKRKDRDSERAPFQNSVEKHGKVNTIFEKRVYLSQPTLGVKKKKERFNLARSPGGGRAVGGEKGELITRDSVAFSETPYIRQGMCSREKQRKGKGGGPEAWGLRTGT